jgi:hypothetical protein
MIYAALVAAAGISLIMLALRGRRIDDHPLCRRCRFDLVGIVVGIVVGVGVGVGGREVRCPECGSKLDGPRSVYRGNRRRRPRLLAIGVLLLVAAGAPMTILAGGRAAGVDWNRHKPEWWLGGEARGRDAAAAGAAMQELAGRLRERRISPQLAQHLIALALERQADLNSPWAAGWTSYLDVAHRSGVLTPEQVQRYLRHGVRITLESPSRARPGAPLQVELWVMPFRLPAHTDLMLHGQIVDYALNGDRIPSRTFNRTVTSLSSQGGGVFLLELPPELSPDRLGRYNLVIGTRFWVEQASDQLHPLAQWDAKLPLDFNVPDTALVSIAALADEALRAPIRSAIELHPPRIVRSGGVLSTQSNIFVRSSPADIAFEVVWRYQDQSGEWREAIAGTLAMTARTTGGRLHTRHMPEGFTARRVDIILRSSPEVAREVSELEQIWGGEIVFGDVEVEWAPGTEPQR